ncbi:MAG: MIP/aquaporin family protein [Chloroflexota bacterium]
MERQSAVLSRRQTVPEWPRRIAVEVFGTFALVFVAVGADAMGKVSDGAVSDAARAVAPGLVVAAMVLSLGDVSGAHFNPVVTLAFSLKRLFPARWLVPYWIAQLAGAITAALVVRAMFGDAVRAGVSTPHLVASGTAVAIEAVLTWFLVVVILGTADRARIVGPDAALAVGATIALCGLIALPIEGASMNPARSLAPALVTGAFGDVWIYVLGPLIGGCLAVGLTRLVHGATDHDSKAEEAAQGEAADGTSDPPPHSPQPAASARSAAKPR